MSFAKNVNFFLTLFVMGFALNAFADSESDWHQLQKGNFKFIRDPRYIKERAEVVDGQNPHYVILSCSDSRVPPEIIFNQGLGDLFVTRVAGNVTDTIIVDSIEFAVQTWDVTTLIVMGHTDCGAVEGALARLRQNGGRIDEPRGDHLNAVLIPIETAIVEAGINIWAADALEQATKANVAYSVKELLRRSPVIVKALLDGQIIIVGAEYSLKSGHVEQLFIVDRCGYSYDAGWGFTE